MTYNDPIMNRANNGDPEAQNIIGQRYLGGFDDYPVDEEQAFYWLSKAADNGVISAQYNIGLMYLNGSGTEQDEDQAFIRIKEAAENDFEDAYQQLAIFYCNEVGTDRNLREAMIWADKAFQSGNENAAELIEFIKGETLEQIEEINRLKRSANEGDVDAQFTLGDLYFWGNDIPQNYEEAFSWMKMAAENGVPEAQHNLSNYYYQGVGTEIDEAASFYWIKEAASHEFAPSFFILAVKYFNGSGTNRDLQAALLWAEKAKEHANEEAENFLHLVKEEISKGKQETAVNLVQSSSNDKKETINKDSVNQEEIEYCLKKATETVTSNTAEAFQYFLKAANLGSPVAQYNLGIMYGSGIGVEINKVLSYHWMKKAAQNDYVDAFYYLAIKYANGEGIRTNYERALYWAKKAATVKDDQRAVNLIKILEERIGSSNLTGKETVNNNTVNQKAQKNNCSIPEADQKKLEAEADKLYENENKEEALSLLRKLANMGNTSAMYKLGSYHLGLNKDEINKWLTLGAEKNSLDCARLLVFKASVDQNEEQFIKYCEKAALLGDKDYAIHMAGRYMLGSGVPTDLEQALKYANIAKAGGHVDVDDIIEAIHERNMESPERIKQKELFTKALELDEMEQYDESLELLEEAAKLDSPEAYYQIGYHYANGYGKLPIDNHQAYFFSEISTRLGFTRALYNTAIYGNNTKIQMEDQPQMMDNLESLHTMSWYMKGLAAGNQKCLEDVEEVKNDYLQRYNFPSEYAFVNQLYNAYIHKDYNMIMQMETPACFICNVDVLCLYAHFYENGINPYEVDYKVALYYYKNAAECGSSYAMYKVGEFYERGVGCQRDLKIAEECYKISAKWGYREAKERCRSLGIKY